MPRAWHLLLGFSYVLLVTCEDPHSEGLSSTILEVSSMSNLESADSSERGSDSYPDTDYQHSLIHTPQGSGFSSQETEEISIFQSPKYFWDDEARKSNATREDDRARTDGPDTSSIYGLHQEESPESSSSQSPRDVVETSTILWPRDPEEMSTPASPATETPEEEDPVHTTAQDERTALLPDTEERTPPKMILTSTVHPTSKTPRKNRKHPWSKNHHSNHEPESRPGPPADSWGLPAGHSLPGPGYHEDESLTTQSLHIASEEGKIRFSTQRDNYPTKAAPPSDVSVASHQVICKDWINLAGKNYVILNMSDDIDCEEFRWQRGQHLLSLLEGALAWKTDPPQRDWVIFLSKPNDNDNHLLMTITDEERVVPVKDVFTALGDIKRSLAEIGIESYSSTVSCQSRPSPPRSDYGKLFIVLVIIGSICVMIIIAGLIYICWQRRLPKLKNMELHFVENGCHDNPTLDVAMDGQSEMQEKKTSLNGGTSHRADGWETLINKTNKDETETMEEDTHL